MPVKRQGKLNGIKAKLENAQKRGLALSGQLVAQRATEHAHVATGRLKRSITSSSPKPIAGGNGFFVDVGTNVEYAEEEEFRPGTKDGTPHAYLRPALEASRKEIRKIMVTNIKAAFR